MAKINEVKNKIPNITNLATNTPLTAFDYKITEHSTEHSIYITTQKFNNLAAENFTARLKQSNLANKGDIAYFFKKIDFDDKLKKLNKKVTANKSKLLLVDNELKELQGQTVKLQTYDLNLFIRQSYFVNDGAQLYYWVHKYNSKDRFDRKKRKTIKHKDLLSHIKIGKEILTFDDIEIEKKVREIISKY